MKNDISKHDFTKAVQSRLIVFGRLSLATYKMVTVLSMTIFTEQEIKHQYYRILLAHNYEAVDFQNCYAPMQIFRF